MRLYGDGTLKAEPRNRKGGKLLAKFERIYTDEGVLEVLNHIDRESELESLARYVDTDYVVDPKGETKIVGKHIKAKDWSD